MQSWVDFGQGDFQANYGLQIRETGDSTVNDGPGFDSSTHFNQGADTGGSAGRPVLAMAWNEVPPAAPTNVTAAAVTNGYGAPPTSATVGWTIPTTGTEASDYKLITTVADTGQPVSTSDYPRSSFGMCGNAVTACAGRMSYTVGGLTGVTYSFTVQAANNGGPGPLSGPAQATMWLAPQLSIIPVASSTRSGDQGTWTVSLANHNDRPSPAAVLVGIPAGLAMAPLTGWIDTNASAAPGDTKAACVTAAAYSPTMPTGQCVYFEGPTNAFFANLPTIAAHHSTHGQLRCRGGVRVAAL